MSRISTRATMSAWRNWARCAQHSIAAAGWRSQWRRKTRTVEIDRSGCRGNGVERDPQHLPRTKNSERHDPRDFRRCPPGFAAGFQRNDDAGRPDPITRKLIWAVVSQPGENRQADRVPAADRGRHRAASRADLGGIIARAEGWSRSQFGHCVARNFQRMNYAQCRKRPRPKNRNRRHAGTISPPSRQ